MAKLILSLENLQKGAAMPIGTRKIREKPGHKGIMVRYWEKKMPNGKWEYDGMVTDREHAAHLEAQKVKVKGENKLVVAKKAEDKHKANQTAGTPQVVSDRPTDAVLDKSPRKVQMYWRDVTDSARDLCDKTGVLCLNKEAEDYVNRNLGKVFEMTAGQKADMATFNAGAPAGTTSEWSDDPLFMGDAINYLKNLVKYYKSDAGKQQMFEYYKSKGSLQYTVVDGDTFSKSRIYEGDMKIMESMLEGFERHENDKIILNRLVDMDKAVQGAYNLTDIPAALNTVICEDMIKSPYPANSGGMKGIYFLKDQSSFANVPMLDELVAANQEIFGPDCLNITAQDLRDSKMSPQGFNVALSVFMSTAMLPQGDELARRYYANMHDNKQHFTVGFYGSATNFARDVKILFDLNTIEKLQNKMQDKYPYVQKFLTKYMQTVSLPGTRQAGGYQEFGLEQCTNCSVGFKKLASLRDMSRDLKDLQRRNLFKSEALSRSNQAKIQATIDGFHLASDNLGDIPLEHVPAEGARELDAIHEHLSATMRPLVKLNSSSYTYHDNAYDFKRALDSTGMSRVNLCAGSSNFNKRLNSSIALATGVVTGPQKGRGRRGRGGREYTKMTTRYHTMEYNADNEKANTGLVSKCLRTKMTNLTVDGYRNRDFHIDGSDYIRRTVGYAIGVNHSIRKLSAKAKLIPEWTVGDYKPYTKDNPVVGNYSTSASYSNDYQDSFDKQVTKAHEGSIAGQLGLTSRAPKSTVRTMPVIALEGKGQAGVDEANKTIVGSATHVGRVVHASHVFDIKYHDYYDDYKKIEQAHQAAGKHNVEYMYHGTDFIAGQHIIKGGFKVMPRGQQKAGRMLGDGIYLAKSSTKCAQYVGGGFSGHGQTGVMLKCRAALGKVNEGRKDANGYPYGTVDGYTANMLGEGGRDNDPSIDTVYAKEGVQYANYSRPIAADEWCVKKARAVVPIQWIEVTT